VYTGQIVQVAVLKMLLTARGSPQEAAKVVFSPTMLFPFRQNYLNYPLVGGGHYSAPNVQFLAVYYGTTRGCRAAPSCGCFGQDLNLASMR